MDEYQSTKCATTETTPRDLSRAEPLGSSTSSSAGTSSGTSPGSSAGTSTGSSSGPCYRAYMNN